MLLNRVRVLSCYLTEDGVFLMEVERLSDHTQHVFSFRTYDVTDKFLHNREAKEEAELKRKK